MAVSCLVVTGPCPAATYKWVDEQGVTHYGQQPPAAGKARQVEIPVSPPARPAAPAQPEDGKAPKKQETPGERLRKQEQEFQQRRIERLEREHKEEEQQARARAAAKAKCINARNRLEVLQQDRPVYRLDEKGERIYIDDKVRAATIARMRKDIAESCPSR